MDAADDIAEFLTTRTRNARLDHACQPSRPGAVRPRVRQPRGSQASSLIASKPRFGLPATDSPWRSSPPTRARPRSKRSNCWPAGPRRPAPTPPTTTAVPNAESTAPASAATTKQEQLTDLVRQDKVRYIGSSSFSAGEIVEAQWAARERGLQRFRTEQPPYSLLVRGIELDVLPAARRHGMGVLTYSPLAGRWLSGRWTTDSSPTSPARQRLAARFAMSLPDNQRKLEATQTLAEVADDAGISLIELAIAFVVNHPAVTSAIIGPRTMEQLDSQLPAADVALDAAILDRVDEIVAPGVNSNPADTSYGEQVLQPALRRR